jgi:hypothetical protein
MLNRDESMYSVQGRILSAKNEGYDDVSGVINTEDVTAVLILLLLRAVPLLIFHCSLLLLLLQGKESMTRKRAFSKTGTVLNGEKSRYNC